MIRYLVIVCLMLVSSVASAHEWTPTYPKLEHAYVDGVMVLHMKLFNKREDVEFYEIQVFDSSWNPMPFATAERIVQVRFLTYKDVDVYIRAQDKDKVTYICSRSKLAPTGKDATLVASRICSKVK